MKIRPMKDLRNTNEISELAHRDQEPLFITKNGYADLVIMAHEVYERWQTSGTAAFVNSGSYQLPGHEPIEEHNFGYVKVACASPKIQVANPDFNVTEIMKVATTLAAEHVRFALFPELSLTGYTCQDLFLQDSLLRAVEQALAKLLAKSRELAMVIVVGAPLRVDQKLYNCAIVIKEGEILGVVPKTAIPNYQEFYELRHFEPAPSAVQIINLLGQSVPFGSRILFGAKSMPSFLFAIEICEDLWMPDTPSTSHALAGATMIANLSASPETVGKKQYREMLVKATSARLLSAYLYCDAGIHESTTDLVFSGANIIAENGSILQASPLFSEESIITEIDISKLINERQRMTSFPQKYDGRYHYVSYDLSFERPVLTRRYPMLPFVPSKGSGRDETTALILEMQAMGLRKRMEHTKAKTLVVGLSGGLDSTLALLVAVEAMKLLGRSSHDIHCLTMPCFGTSERTRNNAHRLAEALEVTLKEIDITKSVTQHLQDLDHQGQLDVTYENAQARERTQVLMDYANQTGGLVVGTGDLSELALGWATYNGDHMSNYGVNASIPKTLVRFLVERYGQKHQETQAILTDILDTPVSPELLPLEEGQIAQKTEDILGPYELHDFFLYHFLRHRFSIAKICFLAEQTFAGHYDQALIHQTFRLFLKRFFSQQFKRSCLPDGVKVGSVSLSPRGDLRMPSDASSEAFIEALDQYLKEEHQK